VYNAEQEGKNSCQVMWIPVTTAWSVLGLRMMKMVSRYGQ